MEQWQNYFKTAFGFSPAYLLVLIPAILVLARGWVERWLVLAKVSFLRSSLFWYGLAGFILLLGLVVNLDVFKQWYRPDVAVGLLLGAATVALALTFEPAQRVVSGAAARIRGYLIGQEQPAIPQLKC